LSNRRCANAQAQDPVALAIVRTVHGIGVECAEKGLQSFSRGVAQNATTPGGKLARRRLTHDRCLDRALPEKPVT
jgi:hypothetical protein